jgi:hypothetical protein
MSGNDTGVLSARVGIVVLGGDMFDSWRIAERNHPSRRVAFELGYWRKKAAEVKTFEERWLAERKIAEIEAAVRCWESAKRRIPSPPLRGEPGRPLT